MQKKKFKAVELRHLDQETIEKIREWRNQDFVRQMMFSRNIIDTDTHNQWIERMRQDVNRYLFVFYLDGEPFGVVQFVCHPDRELVETGNYLIDEEYQLMGYGVIMEFFMREIIFYHLSYQKMYGEMLDINNRVLRLSKYFEDVNDYLPGHIMVDGKFRDVVACYSDRISWDEHVRAKIEPLISHMVDLNYSVIK